MIFKLQLALFKPAQLQFILPSGENNGINHRIEVAMLDFQFNNTPLYVFRLEHRHVVAPREKFHKYIKMPFVRVLFEVNQYPRQTV